MTFNQQCCLRLRSYLLLCALLVLTACTGVTRHPVPAQDYLETRVLGSDDFRFWGDDVPPSRWAELTRQNPDRDAVLKEFPGVTQVEHNYLAISGGGAEGAYGAGLLVGWTEAGTRPQFTMVSGVSTGALTAPFAFLGSAYDEQLKQVYTTMDSASIFRMRSLLNLFQIDAVADATPLKQVLEKYINDKFIAEIAVQHRLGRTLLICTTNLDAGRPVIWNIGRIANSGKPGAANLVRQVILASAAVPGVFAPVYIEVETADGKVYDEMHVDGGTSAQMFLYPAKVDWGRLTELLEVQGEPTAYLIRNSYAHSDYSAVEPRVLPIIKKTVDSLIRYQGIGDAYRIYTLAKRDGIDVKLTWIPQGSVAVESRETFDPVYMTALFEYGFKRGKAQNAWVSVEEVIEGSGS